MSAFFSLHFNGNKGHLLYLDTQKNKTFIQNEDNVLTVFLLTFVCLSLSICLPICLFAMLSISDVFALECLYLTLFSDLSSIFSHSGALRRAPGGTDGWCPISGGGQGWSNQKDLTFDGFKGAVPLVTHENPLRQIW